MRGVQQAAGIFLIFLVAIASFPSTVLAFTSELHVRHLGSNAESMQTPLVENRERSEIPWYVFTTLSVGDQSFVVEVSLSNTLTALSCKECVGCGPGSNPQMPIQLDPNASPVCNPTEVGIGLGLGTNCSFNYFIPPNSTLAGHYVKTNVTLGPLDSNNRPLGLNIGCLQTVNDVVYKDFSIDGVLGLQQHRGTDDQPKRNLFWEALESSNGTQHTRPTFSLCMDSTGCGQLGGACGGGVFTIGEIDAGRHIAPLRYSPLLQPQQQSLGEHLPAAYYILLLDSATVWMKQNPEADNWDFVLPPHTIGKSSIALFSTQIPVTIMSANMYDTMLEQIQMACNTSAALLDVASMERPCGLAKDETLISVQVNTSAVPASLVKDLPELMDEDGETCFVFASDTEAALKNMPVVDFSFANGAELQLTASKYLYRHNETTYCMAVSPTKQPNLVAANVVIFGLIAMQDMQIVFDMEQQQIGIAPANCSSAFHGSTDQTGSTTSTDIVMQLFEGQAQVSDVSKKNIRHFYFLKPQHSSSGTQQLTVTLTPMTGDADLSIPTRTKNMTSATPGVDQISLDLDAVEGDRIDIYVNGYAGFSRFNVMASLGTVRTLVPGMPQTMTGKVGDGIYFRYKAPVSTTKSVLFRVTPATGDTDLYVRRVKSGSGEEASSDEFDWSSTRYYTNEDEVVASPPGWDDKDGVTADLSQESLLEYSILVRVVSTSQFTIRVDLSGSLHTLRESVPFRDFLAAGENQVQYYSYFAPNTADDIRIEVTRTGSGTAPVIYVGCTLAPGNSEHTFRIPSVYQHVFASDNAEGLSGLRHNHPYVIIRQSKLDITDEDEQMCVSGGFMGVTYYIAVMSPGKQATSYSILVTRTSATQLTTLYEGEDQMGVASPKSYRFYQYLVDLDSADAATMSPSPAAVTSASPSSTPQASRIVQISVRDLVGQSTMYVSYTYLGRLAGDIPCSGAKGNICDVECKCDLFAENQICASKRGNGLPSTLNLCRVSDSCEDTAVKTVNQANYWIGCNPSLYPDWQLPVREDTNSYMWTTKVSALGNVLVNITALEEAHPDLGHGLPFLALTVGVIGHVDYPESMFTITASENAESGEANGGGGSQGEPKFVIHRPRNAVTLANGIMSQQFSSAKGDVTNFIFKLDGRPSGDVVFIMTVLNGDVDMAVSRVDMPVWAVTRAYVTLNNATWATRGYGNESIHIELAFPCEEAILEGEPCLRDSIFDSSIHDGTFKVSVLSMVESIFAVTALVVGDYIELRMDMPHTAITHQLPVCATGRDANTYSCTDPEEKLRMAAMLRAQLSSVQTVKSRKVGGAILDLSYSAIRDSATALCADERLVVVATACWDKMCLADQKFPEIALTVGEHSKWFTKTSYDIHGEKAENGLQVPIDIKTLCPPNVDFESSQDTCNVYASVEFSGPAECANRRIPFSVTFRLADASNVVSEICLGQGRLCVPTGTGPENLTAEQQRSYDVFTGQEKVDHIGVELEACSGDLSLSVCTTVDRVTGRCQNQDESTLVTSAMNGLAREIFRKQTINNHVDASMYRLTVANRLDVGNSTFILRVIKGDMPKLTATTPLSLSSQGISIDVSWTPLSIENNSTGTVSGGHENKNENPDIVYRVYWWNRSKEKAGGVYSTPCGLEKYCLGSSDTLNGDQLGDSKGGLNTYRIENLASGFEYGVAVVAECKQCEAIVQAEQVGLGENDNDAAAAIYKLETAFARAYITMSGSNGEMRSIGGHGWQTVIVSVLVLFVIFLLIAMRRVAMAKGDLQSRLDFEMADMRSLARSDMHVGGGGEVLGDSSLLGTSDASGSGSGAGSGGVARRIFGDGSNNSGPGYEPLTQT